MSLRPAAPYARRCTGICVLIGRASALPRHAKLCPWHSAILFHRRPRHCTANIRCCRPICAPVRIRSSQLLNISAALLLQYMRIHPCRASKHYGALVGSGSTRYMLSSKDGCPERRATMATQLPSYFPLVCSPDSPAACHRCSRSSRALQAEGTRTNGAPHRL